MGETVKVVRMIVALVLAVLVFNVSDVSASEPLDDSQQLFFSQFRYAVQAHDASRLVTLTHPASLACVPEEDWEYYYGRVLDGLVQILGKRQAVQLVRKTGIAPGEFDAGGGISSRDDVNWPVVPEVRLILQYERQGRKAVAALYLAKDNNEWKWVHVCTGQ